MHTYIYTHTHKYICTYTHTYTHIYIYMYIYIYIYLRVCVYIYIYVYMCVSRTVGFGVLERSAEKSKQSLVEEEPNALSQGMFTKEEIDR